MEQRSSRAGLSRRALLGAVGAASTAVALSADRCPVALQPSIGDISVGTGQAVEGWHVDVLDPDDVPVAGAQVLVSVDSGDILLVGDDGRSVRRCVVVSSAGGRARAPVCVAGASPGTGVLTLTALPQGVGREVRVEVVRGAGTVLGWGRGLGTGPGVLAAPPAVRALVGGAAGLLAIAAGGAVHAWGGGRSFTEVDGAGAGPLDALHVGGSSVLGVREGKLRHERPSRRRGVSALPGLVGAVSLGRVVHLLDADGTLWRAGGGDDAPVSMAGPTGVVSLSAGLSAAFATTADGDVWAWGDGRSGQLGPGVRACREPVRVPGLPARVRAVTASAATAYAVLDDGEVWSWGADDRGQAGSGRTGVEPVPRRVSDLPPVDRVAAAGRSVLALDVAGDVWGWGRNDAGQLGDGSHRDRGRPVPAVARGPFADVATDGWTTLVLS